MIPRHQEGIAFDGGRTPFAETVADVHLSQIDSLPLQSASHRVAEETARPEECKNVRAVRARRGGSKSVRSMCFLMRLGDRGGLLPEQLSALPSEAEEFEFKHGQISAAVTGQRHSRCDKDLFVPDNGGRRPTAGNLDFPFNVLGRVPLRRRSACVGGTITVWPPPMPPVIGHSKRAEPGHAEQKQDGNLGQIHFSLS